MTVADTSRPWMYTVASSVVSSIPFAVIIMVRFLDVLMVSFSPSVSAVFFFAHHVESRSPVDDVFSVDTTPRCRTMI